MAKPLCECGSEIDTRSKSCRDCYYKKVRDNKVTKYTSRGYVYLLKPDHPRADRLGYFLEHIVVMEKVLGRFLLPTENVHHINGVRNDNRVENLELWTKPQPQGIRVSDAIKWAKEILKTYS